MRKSQTDKKRFIPLILCSVLVLQQSLTNQAAASTITDGNGVPINTHPGTGHYEIRPDAWNGKVGFKEFQQLKLDEGDIMNFIFQWYNQAYDGDPAHNRGDIDTFVNFINNRAEINGVVNALTQLGGELKDNGNLVFVSPNGVVVGASGVLNVGSLQVFTPTQESFNALKSGIDVAERDPSTGMSLSQETSTTWNPSSVALGNGQITVNGKVLARNDIELNGGRVNVGNGGLLIAGVGNNTEVFTDKAAADTLFESLVNTDNMDTGSGFANANGKIVITSNIGTNIENGANLKNFAANSDTTITNTGADGVTIAGEISNPNGTLSVTNNNGNINITSTGDLKNKGDMIIRGQNASNGITVDGTLVNDGDMTIEETTASGTTGVSIGGDVTNNTGAMRITNSLAGGLNVTSSGNVTSNGTSLTMINQGVDGFVIDGDVLNNAGDADLINQRNGDESNRYNKFNINGTVTSNGTSLDITNEAGEAGLNIAGKVLNNLGIAKIQNQSGGLNVTSTGSVTSNGSSLIMDNKGDGGFVIDGLVANNTGEGTLNNDNNKLDINGTVTSDGDRLNINNTNGINGLNISGTVDNNNGYVRILNGKGGLNVKTGGHVINDGNQMSMTNNGESGFTIDGTVTNNNGLAELTNTQDVFNINGTVTGAGSELDITNSGANGLNIAGLVENNTGTASITNTKGGLNVLAGGQVTSDGTSLTMLNDGTDGFNVDGEIINNQGTATLTNNQKSFNVNVDGSITSNGDDLNITNNGTEGLNVAGLINNARGAAHINNTQGGLNVLAGGSVLNAGDSLLMENSGANGMNIQGTVDSTAGTTTINNSGAGGLKVAEGGLVQNSGVSLEMNNTGNNGFTIDGTVNNNNGTAQLNNEAGSLLISSKGKVNSKGTELNVNNSGTGGLHVEGLVTHTNTDGIVNFTNSNSDMVIGHDRTDNNISSDADVNINVTNGNLLNYFADIEDANTVKTLITTTSGADLNIDVTNGSIGTEVGPCDGDVCTGVGPSERDLTKSINTSIDGAIIAESTGTGALINMASLDKDMHVNRIHSDGRVILLADDKTNKGETAYDVINSADDNSVIPNIQGSGISVIASGDIGKAEDKITFIQTGATVDIANENDNASDPHDLYETPRIDADGGVEFLAIGDINIKGNDNADKTKNDTNVCTIASREGTVNAEFSGNTYIRDITAQNEVNVVNRGPEIYIENLGGAPSRYETTGDYYGMYDGIVPEKATITALDLGTVENPNHTPNSTIVVKNGTINGKGSTSHPNLDQDITVTADNAYVGGYYFNMGKHREGGLTEWTYDDTTNTIVNAGDPDTPVSIRAKAVRPDDVTDIGRNPVERDYYYADLDGDGEPENPYPDGESGSGQKDDPTFDPDKETGDDLVVPEPDPAPGDDDDDGPVDPGDDDDDGPVDPGDDDDDGPVDPGDDDDDGPVDPGDDDDDGPVDPGDDDDDGPVTPPGDDDDIPDVNMDDAKRTWKKEIDDNISVIDKRQYMRFDINNNPNPVVFESDPTVDGILNISRGGVQLSHNNTLKVGDVVPVHIKYGDVEINTEVKIVTATDVRAGGEFVDLDLATANKLLYLSLLMDETQPQDQYYANTNNGSDPNSDSLSTTGVDD